MSFLDVPEGAVCQNCGERPATAAWVGEGSMLDAVHGNFQWWCELCALKASLAYAEGLADRIPDLKRRIAALESK